MSLQWLNKKRSARDTCSRLLYGQSVCALTEKYPLIRHINKANSRGYMHSENSLDISIKKGQASTNSNHIQTFATNNQGYMINAKDYNS